MEFIASTISRIDLMISFSDMKFCQNIKPHINIYSYNCTDIIFSQWKKAT